MTVMHEHLLGVERAVLRRSHAYSVVAILVLLGILAIDVAVFLSGAVFVAAAIAFAAVALVVFFIRGQRRSRITLHENGLVLWSGIRHETLLWDDIKEIRPSFSYVEHPNTLVDMAITRRSGGRVVIRNNWEPRLVFVSLIEDLLAIRSRLT